jgi:hypothetical protein
VAAGVGLRYLAVRARQAEDALKSEQDHIVSAIKDFQRDHGRLPANLAEVKISEESELLGRISYRPNCRREGQFEIRCLLPRFLAEDGWDYDSDDGQWWSWSDYY